MALAAIALTCYNNSLFLVSKVDNSVWEVSTISEFFVFTVYKRNTTQNTEKYKNLLSVNSLSV